MRLLIKKLIFQILSLPPINSVVRTGIRPFKSFLPNNQLVRIPVVGRIKIQYPGINEFSMISDGRDTIASGIFWHGIESFEYAEMQVYSKLLDYVTTVIDVGSNTGIYSLLAGIHPTPQKVYSFEPMPAIAAALRHNVAANQLDNIHVAEIALTDSDGIITLHIPQQSTFATGSSTNQAFRQNTISIDVVAMSLDTFASQSNLDEVGLIKIDTESTEPSVLRGGANLIDRNRPLIICEILRNDAADAIMSFFAERTYDYFHITKYGLKPIERIGSNLEETNYLFVPLEKRHLVEKITITSQN